MPYIKYCNFRFGKAAKEIIDLANGIISEYQKDGYNLTLRQLYYQFVARGLIRNNDKEYVKLGSILNRGRLAGLIDWEAIVDRTRFSRSINHWASPERIIQASAEQYAVDTRADQDYYVEVWVEKDALIDVVEQVCNKEDVACLSCRGYVSQTAIWEAAQRFIGAEDNGKETILLHLGDHDPSGIDMSRDIQDRLDMFGSSVTVQRIALIMDQIEEYNPPPNPAKLTDSRCNKYIERYGEESWELDALDPRTITGIIQENIEYYTDRNRKGDLENLQEAQRQQLLWIADNWRDVLGKKGE
jgi:hypothetical protein